MGNISPPNVALTEARSAHAESPNRVQGKLDNPEFRAKAPETVIVDQEARAEELRAAIERLE